jgi:hypothetical protein
VTKSDLHRPSAKPQARPKIQFSGEVHATTLKLPTEMALLASPIGPPQCSAPTVLAIVNHCKYLCCKKDSLSA